MKREDFFSLVMGSMLALALVASKARAADDSDWGDLNYSDTPSPEVSEIPSSMAESESVNRTDSSAELSPESKKLSDAPSTKSDTNMKFAENPDTESTARTDTFGVQTDDNTKRFYIAPYLGFGSVMGNDTAQVSPRYAIGGSAGFLVSDRMLVEAGFTYNEQNFSNSKTNVGTSSVGFGDSNVFALKQSTVRVGGKFFFLGRDSKIRPYAGGGLGWSRGSFNYTDGYLAVLASQGVQYMNEMTITQYGGYGELGAEYAITPKVVVNGNFKLSGAISGSSNGQDQVNASSFDPNKLSVGNSLAKSASYLLGLSVGVYF